MKLKMSVQQQMVNDIRVVTVTKDGVLAAASSLGDRLARLKPTGFVAIDTEFSGLPDDPDMRSDNLQTRYKALRRIAHNRAVFSVGISIFNPVSDSPNNKKYEVATYDFLLSCQSKFEMRPSAGSFLEAHGFDFNRMFRDGIPYKRASELEMQQARAKSRAAGREPVELKEEERLVDEATQSKKGDGNGEMEIEGQENKSDNQKDMSNQNARQLELQQPQAQPFIYGQFPRGLLWRIGRHGCPVIVHNGLMDLVFMYAAFQGILPLNLNGFVGALLDCVPAGYWDSKVLAPTSQLSDDLIRHHRASFLSYLFAKSVLDENISVHNSQGLPRFSLPHEEPIIRLNDPSVLCALFAFRGFCPRGTGCPFSHDPFRVVIEEREGKAANDAKDAHKRHKAQSKLWKRQIEAVKTEDGKLSKKQRKRKFEEVTPTENDKDMKDSSSSDLSSTTSPQKKSPPVDEDNKKLHTAGWDAFCTGYIFAAFRASTPHEKLEKEHNYIAIPNRLSNLLIRRSEYADLDG